VKVGFLHRDLKGSQASAVDACAVGSRLEHKVQGNTDQGLEKRIVTPYA
jgi:hypothetical protein